MVKRILFVGDASSIHLRRWIDYYQTKGYMIYLATFSHVNVTTCENIYYLSGFQTKTSGKNYHYLFCIKKLAHIIQKIRPDYINAHFSYSMGFITLLSLKISKISVPFSVVCHGSDVLDYPLFICKYLNRFVFKYADKIIAVSGQIADRLESWGVESNKIWVGQYGVDMPHVEHLKRDIDVISIRSYVPNSRVDQLLQALTPELCKSKKIVFVLPGIYELELEKLKLLYPWIELYGSLPHKEILQLLQRSKVYLSATKSDGSSLSLLEALAAGAIPVVSDILSNREWIVNGLNGVLFRQIQEVPMLIRYILELADFKKKKIEQMNKQLIQQRGEYNLQMEKIEKELFTD